jgi:hypothetical protein
MFNWNLNFIVQINRTCLQVSSSKFTPTLAYFL